MKAMHDTMGPEQLVSSLLFFGMGQLLVINRPLPERKEILAALSIRRVEIGTMSAQLKTRQVIRSKQLFSAH